MKLRVVSKFLGFMALFISVYMIIPLLVSIVREGEDQYAFARSIFTGLCVAFALLYYGRNEAISRLGTKEVYMSVALAWVIASAIGAFPYWLYGAAGTYTDAFFESMSGFTTTGATILDDPGKLPLCLLVWKAMTHWLGGMGIIGITLVMLPLAGTSGFKMYSAESPGIAHEKLTPRLHQMAISLWGIYFALTAVLALLLALGGMDFWGTLYYAMATVSTGGFAVSSGLAVFKNPFCETVVIIFMFLAGANFVLHFHAVKNRTLKKYFLDPEFRFYCLITGVLSILVSCGLYFSGEDAAIRKGFFNVVSFITTTGFASANYELWPNFAKILLFICLFPGGCAGSTSGGIKQIRLLVTLRHIKRQISRTLDTRSVLAYSDGSGALDPDVMSSCMAFLGMFLAVFAFGAFAVSLFEPDLLTALSGTASVLGNVGPAFGRLGAGNTFAGQAQGAKWVYSFLMLCGRLELYTVLALFTGTFWREGIME